MNETTPHGAQTPDATFSTTDEAVTTPEGVAASFGSAEVAAEQGLPQSADSSALPARRGRGRSALALLGFGLATAAVAALGALATEDRVRGPWFRLFLRKPRYQPPRQAFGPVWTGLYTLMAISGWRVWRTPDSPERTRALALWGGQLALNGAWSAAFFGAKSPTLALADIALLDGAIVAYTHQASKVDKPAAWMFAPYIGWTGFATALNTSIVRLNA